MKMYNCLFRGCLLLTLSLFTALWAYAVENAASPELTFYLVRHGQTWSNIREMTVGGGGNAPLTQKGRYDASSLGLGLAHVPFMAAYSSTLGRAMETADFIVQGRQIAPVVHIEALKDIRWGEAEGGTVDELTQQFGHDGHDFLYWFGRWDDAHFISPVKAETMYQFAGRFENALLSVAKRHQGQSGNILVVAHSSLGFYLQKFRGDAPLVPLSNTSVSVLKYRDGQFRLVDFNNSDYLQHGQKAMQTRAPYDIILLANPLTVLHKRGIIEGLSDSDYTDAGIAVNKALALRLRAVTPAAVWISDLRRADKMAQSVFEGRSTPVSGYDKRLNELFVGHFEATPIDTQAADSALRSEGNMLHFTPAEGAESGVIAAWRLHDFLTDMTHRYTPEQGAIVVFTHPYIMKAFMQRYIPDWQSDNKDGAKMIVLNINDAGYTVKHSETVTP